MPRFTAGSPLIFSAISISAKIKVWLTSRNVPRTMALSNMRRSERCAAWRRGLHLLRTTRCNLASGVVSTFILRALSGIKILEPSPCSPKTIKAGRTHRHAGLRHMQSQNNNGEERCKRPPVPIEKAAAAQTLSRNRLVCHQPVEGLGRRNHFLAGVDCAWASSLPQGRRYSSLLSLVPTALCPVFLPRLRRTR